MSVEHTSGPWRVFRVKSGDYAGNLLGIGDKDGVSIFDAFGGVWRSGAEKRANTKILARFRREYDAVVAAKTLEARRAADAEFLDSVNAYLVDADVKQAASLPTPSAILKIVQKDEGFGQLETSAQRMIVAALTRAKGAA